MNKNRKKKEKSHNAEFEIREEFKITISKDEVCHGLTQTTVDRRW